MDLIFLVFCFISQLSVSSYLSFTQWDKRIRMDSLTTIFVTPCWHLSYIYKNKCFFTFELLSSYQVINKYPAANRSEIKWCFKMGEVLVWNHSGISILLFSLIFFLESFYKTRIILWCCQYHIYLTISDSDTLVLLKLSNSRPSQL